MEDYVPYECFCGKINWVDGNRVRKSFKDDGQAAVSCYRCERIRLIDEIRKSKRPGHENQDYCHCIEFTGPEADLPVGMISVGNRTLYVNATGQAFTSEEWKQKYGQYPKLHIEARIKKFDVIFRGRYRRKVGIT